MGLDIASYLDRELRHISASFFLYLWYFDDYLLRIIVIIKKHCKLLFDTK